MCFSRRLVSARLQAFLLATALLCALAVALLCAPPSQAATVRTLRLWVNQPRDVMSGTRVTVRAVCYDQQHRRIPGVRVSMTWTSATGTHTHRVVTNGRGVASDAHRPRCFSSVFRVRVKVVARWRGQVRTSIRYFAVTPT